MGERVLLTADVVGGVWDFCLVLASQLRTSANASVTLLALGEPSPEQRRRAAGVGATLLSAPLKLEWMRDSEEDVARTQRLVADLVHDIRPDVVHANQFAAACARVDVPVVLSVHSDVLSWFHWTLGTEAVAADWDNYTALVQQGCRSADTVVSVSRFLATEVKSRYGVDRPIEVIHNGWPMPPASPISREPITLVAGRIWDAAKNVTLAAEAAQGWDAGAVYLAGERAHPESLGQIDVPAPLIPLGLLSRAALDGWLRRSAIYLSAARYDPFGLLPLQAALNGCALLLSDIPSYRELWDGAACFFRSDDPTALRRCWHQLRADPDQQAELQQRATERARLSFTPERMAAAYRECYAAGKALIAA
jgi:glycosyltransferase involved in cell wall biosynthesis